jgi:hypothetical protein
LVEQLWAECLCAFGEFVVDLGELVVERDDALCEPLERCELLAFEQRAGGERRRAGSFESCAQWRVERDECCFELIERLLAGVSCASPLDQEQPQNARVRGLHAGAAAVRLLAAGVRPARRQAGHSSRCVGAALAARIRRRRSRQQPACARATRRRSRSPRSRTPARPPRSRTGEAARSPAPRRGTRASPAAARTHPTRQPHARRGGCRDRFATVHCTAYPPGS